MKEKNPTDRTCFILCKACFRCADKGCYAQCSACSGRYDPEGKRDPYDIDDRCDCRNGILRYRTQTGRLIIAKYPHNPYGGDVRADQVTADERDWDAFVTEQRERTGKEDWDPIQFGDGSSTKDWLEKNRRGLS